MVVTFCLRYSTYLIYTTRRALAMTYYKQDNNDRKQIRFGELLDRINKARGDMPLAKWVKQACEEKLKRG